MSVCGCHDEISFYFNNSPWLVVTKKPRERTLTGPRFAVYGPCYTLHPTFIRPLHRYYSTFAMWSAVVPRRKAYFSTKPTDHARAVQSSTGKALRCSQSCICPYRLLGGAVCRPSVERSEERNISWKKWGAWGGSQRVILAENVVSLNLCRNSAESLEYCTYSLK